MATLILAASGSTAGLDASTASPSTNNAIVAQSTSGYAALYATSSGGVLYADSSKANIAATYSLATGSASTGVYGEATFQGAGVEGYGALGVIGAANNDNLAVGVEGSAGSIPIPSCSSTRSSSPPEGEEADAPLLHPEAHGRPKAPTPTRRRARP